jgi:chromosome segregation ATPase
MALEKFDILEEKVSQLAENYTKLKTENESIAVNLQQRERKVSELEATVRLLEEEKEGIRLRLDKIISNLENLSFNF